MPPSEQERLSRMEVQIDGIREDVSEIKVSIKEDRVTSREDSKEMKETVREFTSTLANLHKDFLLREEANKISVERNRERDEAIHRINSLEKRTSKLENWRSWLTGGLGVVLLIITILTALIRDGVIK